MSQRNTGRRAEKARIRRLKAKYRKIMVIIGAVCFVLGAVAGILGYRWYAGGSDVPVAAPAASTGPAATEVPEATEAPNGGQGALDENFFIQDDGEPEEAQSAPEATDAPEEQVPDEGAMTPIDGHAQSNPGEAAPNAGAQSGEPASAAQPEDSGNAPEEQAGEPTEQAGEPLEQTGEPAQQTGVPEEQAGEPEEQGDSQEHAEAETGALPDDGAKSSDEVPEYDPTGAEMPEGYGDDEPQDEGEGGEPAQDGEPQVIAIVPYGESYTYTTQIMADGSARVEADEEPFETISFTQTMQEYMRPSDFADKYATKYKLVGDEAGAGFELILNDYTGEATIIPQNIIDVSFRSESGNDTERGYQLMDAEISGQYDVTLTTNTPKMLYKRYSYSGVGEEMKYMVVTTYNDGVAAMILFEVESDEPEPTPAIIYATLQKGVKSDEVKAMQERLIALGYLTGAADGNFGPATEKAVKAAQTAFGMEPTGIADDAFQHRLFDEPLPTPQPGEEPAEGTEEASGEAPAEGEAEPTEAPETTSVG